MSAYDIAPHSKRTTGLALGLLALVAMAAFTQGFLRQLESDTPPPPPSRNAALADIAEARPAPPPVLQVEAPRPKRAAAEPIPDLTAALDAAQAAAPQAPAATDAAATAPDVAPPAPPPAPKAPDPPF
jgi:hypothetical protein